jgi:hypothetical protein
VRPRTISSLNIHDRHPKKLVRDLFTQYDTIFTQDVSKAQKFGASRATIIADETPALNSISNRNIGSESTLRRTLMHIIRPNATEIETSPHQTVTPQQQSSHNHTGSNGGFPFVRPHSKISIFEDPENSKPSVHHPGASTPSRNSMDKKPWQVLDDVDRVDTKRLSTDVNFMLDPEEDEHDAIEIDEVDNNTLVAVGTPNRSRASTQGTMDNVNLDPFFNED